MADAGLALANSRPASDVRIGEEPADDGNRPEVDLFTLSHILH